MTDRRFLCLLPIKCVGIAIGLALVSGCAGGPGGATLAGTRWRVTRIDGEVPTNPQSARIAFDAAKINVTIGCNRIDGAYRIDGQRLIAGPFSMTEKACDNRLAEEEAAVNALLESAPLLSWQGVRLRLDSGGHALDLERTI